MLYQLEMKQFFSEFKIMYTCFFKQVNAVSSLQHVRDLNSGKKVSFRNCLVT